MTQTLTNEEFGEMMEVAISLVTDLLPGLLVPEATDTIDISGEVTPFQPITTDSEVENITTEIELFEDEVTIDAVILDELTKEELIFELTEEELAEFEEFQGNDDLAINIEEYYFVMTFDKKTLVPLTTSGITHLTTGMGEDSLSIKQKITGEYSNFNAVKEITVPADVIKNAININDYFNSLLKVELEKAELEAAK